MRAISTFYVEKNQINDKNITVIGDDVNHIKNVLRHRIGDKIDICDNEGSRYFTEVESFFDDRIILHILGKTSVTTEMKTCVTLYQGLPKADKLDLIVQKCTELGVAEIVPVITDRVIVKINDSNRVNKVERWKKIASEAAKQSGRQKIPVVQDIQKLENVVENLSKYDIVIVPYENEYEHTLKTELRALNGNNQNIAVVIGPEGGFSDKDIEVLVRNSNVRLVSLGKRILRTETAGIATVAMIMYEYEL